MVIYWYLQEAIISQIQPILPILSSTHPPLLKKTTNAKITYKIAIIFVYGQQIVSVFVFFHKDFFSPDTTRTGIYIDGANLLMTKFFLFLLSSFSSVERKCKLVTGYSEVAPRNLLKILRHILLEGSLPIS